MEISAKPSFAYGEEIMYIISDEIGYFLLFRLKAFDS